MGGVDLPSPLSILVLKRKRKYFGGYFLIGAISLVRIAVPSHKIVTNLLWTYRTMRSYLIKENLIGSALSKTFRY